MSTGCQIGLIARGWNLLTKPSRYPLLQGYFFTPTNPRFIHSNEPYLSPLSFLVISYSLVSSPKHPTTPKEHWDLLPVGSIEGGEAGIRISYAYAFISPNSRIWWKCE